MFKLKDVMETPQRMNQAMTVLFGVSLILLGISLATLIVVSRNAS